MIQTIENIQEYKLIDVENTQIIVSDASLKLNEEHLISIKRSLHTVGEIESGKFRRRFNRHRIAFRFFN